MTLAFGLFSLCPRIRKADDHLVAATGWRVRLLTLGLLYKRVTVDPDKKVVTVYRRNGWFFTRTRQIPFGSIATVTYGYSDVSGNSSWSWAHDSTDLFTVGLRLQDRKQIHLFSFFGDGTFTNDGPLPDWCYIEQYLTDISGTQEKESKVFVDMLSKMVGAPVGPPSAW
jgi:hypothetical protein